MIPPSPRMRRQRADAAEAVRSPLLAGDWSGSAGSARDPANDALPRVWVLAAPRAGDATQVVALAEALGWPYEIKRLAFKPLSLVLAPPFLTSDAGVDRQRSCCLGPPWPDLVLASGPRERARGALDPPAVGGPHPHRPGGPALGSARRLRSRGHHAAIPPPATPERAPEQRAPAWCHVEAAEGGRRPLAEAAPPPAAPADRRAGGWPQRPLRADQAKRRAPRRHRRRLRREPGRLAPGHDQCPNPGACRARPRAAARLPASALSLAAPRRGQPLFRVPGAGRRDHRHRRQRLDGHRGRGDRQARAPVRHSATVGRRCGRLCRCAARIALRGRACGNGSATSTCRRGYTAGCCAWRRQGDPRHPPRPPASRGFRPGELARRPSAGPANSAPWTT